MKPVYFPPQKGFLVIAEKVTLDSINLHYNFGKCTMRAKVPGHKGKDWTYGETKQIIWVLEPGEWWPIGSMWYPRKAESHTYFDMPIISINIHRSFAGRKWVKEKMLKMAEEHLDCKDFHCSDRTITCSSADLNGKVIVAPDKETAIIYSKKVLNECQNMSDPQTSRFSSLILE